jgi:hypothetical protein
MAGIGESKLHVDKKRQGSVPVSSGAAGGRMPRGIVVVIREISLRKEKLKKKKKKKKKRDFFFNFSNTMLAACQRDSKLREIDADVLTCEPYTPPAPAKGKSKGKKADAAEAPRFVVLFLLFFCIVFFFILLIFVHFFFPVTPPASLR